MVFDIFHLFHMYGSSYSFLKHSYHIFVSYDPKRTLEGKVLWKNNYTQNLHIYSKQKRISWHHEIHQEVDSGC
jgi:hypothetical protein